MSYYKYILPAMYFPFLLQGREDCALLILEKLPDATLISATNAALQT